MERTPTISIITPTIGRDSLPNLIHALMNQTCRDFEHLIIPDVQNYKDFGHSVRRDAVLNARGEWILYIDDDDSIVEDGVERLIDLIEQNPEADFIVFPCIRLGEKFFFKDGIVTSIQYIHKRKINDKLIQFTPGGYNHDNMWFKMQRMKYNVVYVDTEPITIVNQIGNGQL